MLPEDLFSKLQNTTYPEGTVLLIFSKDEVRRAHCWRFVRIHRPNLHFEQSFYQRLLNSGDPLQWRYLNKDLESSHEQEQTERAQKFQLKYYWPRNCNLCDFAGTHDFV